MVKVKLVEVLCAFAVTACVNLPSDGPSTPAVEKSDVAEILASLPIASAHLDEVFDAVNSSSVNGYDEEYMMSDLFDSPGKGVGDSSTKAGSDRGPSLRDLFYEYFSGQTKSGGMDAEEFVSSVTGSGLQIYWPYSEDWDGKTFPVITFDPEDGSESNYGYEISFDDNGERVLKQVVVDENMAKERPVWVINSNDDSTLVPLVKSGMAAPVTKSSETGHTQLILKNFTMLRQYDSWFGGASEFLIKCGAADGFKAADDDDLRLYTPSVTDFMVVVKRKQLGMQIPLDIVMLTDLTDQMETLAFLIVEDDGGDTTSWKCEVGVKYNSKSYGLDVSIPYKDKDDIVWRGQLATSYFDKNLPTVGRFGDVKVSFTLL